jgi:cyclohexa-1,5-dienecarbonyl-CoA hydratase
MPEHVNAAPLVNVTPIDDGAIWRVTFGATKGNVLDKAMVAALSVVFRNARVSRPLKAICLEGAGRHFSFGASVQEHLPGHVAVMLADIRHLVLDLLDCQVIVLAAVRGQCLGGGLELATVCHRIFASPDAMLGQPEIALGVFAPIASIVLPARIGRAHGEDLCLTGRTVTADEARQIGLVDDVTPGDPTEAAIAWAQTHLSGRSAASLRLAVKAVRADLTTRIRAELPALEHLYLTELMTTNDATEGLTAFLEKRPPVWRHS